MILLILLSFHLRTNFAGKPGSKYILVPPFSSEPSTSSDAGPSQSGLHDLLVACIAGQIDGGEFRIQGEDPSSREKKLVEITFELSVDKEKGVCALDHRPPCHGRYIISNPDNPSQAPDVSPPNEFSLMRKFAQLCGPYRYLEEDEPSVRIYISTRENPVKWVLNLLYPRQFFSGAFIRSFIAQGMAIHSQMTNKLVIVEAIDLSDVRQEYWLKHRGGKTYYEAVWNLEYLHLLTDKRGKNGFHVDPKYLEISQSADSFPAQMALSDMRFQDVFMYGERHTFSRLFKDIMKSWVYEHRATITSMRTIRQVLDAFIPTWSMVTERKKAEVQKKFAVDTFLFFFRYHPNFEFLYRQVMGSESDIQCNKARGIPTDLSTPVSFQFTYTKAESKLALGVETNSVLYFYHFYIFAIFILTFMTWFAHQSYFFQKPPEKVHLLI